MLPGSAVAEKVGAGHEAKVLSPHPPLRKTTPNYVMRALQQDSWIKMNFGSFHCFECTQVYGKVAGCLLICIEVAEGVLEALLALEGRKRVCQFPRAFRPCEFTLRP